MMTQHICSICTDDLVDAFDELGNRHVAVRLQSCGHVMHRTCIYIWYTKKVKGGRSPDCPCCYATIEEGRDDFRPCYFSGPDDGSSRLEALCPQESLSSFNSGTRQALQLSALLMKLKQKLSAPDQSKYESMVENIKRGLDPTTWQDDEFDEGYETLKEMVEHVGQMWAVEGTQTAFKELRDEYKKWESICESLERTRKNKSEYERIRDDCEDFRIKWAEAKRKNKIQAGKTVEKVTAAVEKAAKKHELELEREKQTSRDDFMKAFNGWQQKNLHLQAQVDELKDRLAATVKERDEAQKNAEVNKCRANRLQTELAAVQAQLSRRKSRAEVVHCENGYQQAQTHEPEDVVDDPSDTSSDGLEVADAEDEELSVPPLKTFLRDNEAPKFFEPTKREFKVTKRWPDEATSRKKQHLSTLIPFPGPDDQSNAANPRPTPSPSAPTQHPLHRTSIIATTRDIQNHIQRSVSDPFLVPDDRPAPSAQLSSGPRFQSNVVPKPGDSGRDWLKKRSSDIFPDNTRRANGIKKRVRAVLPNQ